MKVLKKQFVAFPLAALTVATLFVSSCKKDEPKIGGAPTEADAKFSYKETTANPNIIEFTASNANLQAKWDFGDNTTGEGTTIEHTYPNKGDYTVTLTVFNSGGSASYSEVVKIENDDISLLDDPLYEILTGGINGPGSRTWSIDSTLAGHFGVGPTSSYWPEWYGAAPLEKSGAGMYDDRFTFTLQGFKFDQKVFGEVFLNKEHGDAFTGAYENSGDLTAPFTDQLGETWTITKDDDTTITVTGNSFIGYYSGVQEYQILELTEQKMVLRYADSKNPDLVWYLTLSPEGVSNGEPITEFSLPFDFESLEPTFSTFGNSTATVVSNPNSGGINTSSKVLESVHGNETWAGFYVNLDAPLDFSMDHMIKLKVLAPDTGTFRIKVENQANSTENVELDVHVGTANQWVEVGADFSSYTGTFDRLVLFPGWDVANAGTFYIDDIKQD